jgi:hypothetical protein
MNNNIWLKLVFLNKSSCLAQALVLTKFIIYISMNLVTICCAALIRGKWITIFGWSLFAEQKLMLNSTFSLDQIHNRHCHEFGHTLLCYFDVQQTGFWGGFVEHLSWSYVAWQSVTKVTTINTLNLVTPKASAKQELLLNKLAPTSDCWSST